MLPIYTGIPDSGKDGTLWDFPRSPVVSKAAYNLDFPGYTPL